MSILAVAGVTKRFGATVAVEDVSLDIGPDDFLALLGPSGCGKTTLLRIIAGFERADAGRLTLDGRDVADLPPYRRPVNMMFQSYALFPHMTVAENVAFGLRQDGLNGHDLQLRVAEALQTVELAGLETRKPDQLSGGQQQRVALARCIAKRPRVLLLDEPMAALDKALRERTQLELVALRRRLGIPFIVVTHDQDEAMTMASRVAVMAHGRILQEGPPATLYARPASRAVAAFFGDANLWDATATVDSVVCPALGLTLPRPAGAPTGPALTLAVRPEHVSLDSAGEIAVKGTIAEVIYRGPVSTYLVRCGDTIVRALRPNTSAPLPVGAAVMVSWPADAILLLPS
jgi:ABC-type Fe3+/spermidine/putrescine transport system ATPase subunit